MKITKSKLKDIIKEEFERKIAPQTQDILDRRQAERYAKKFDVPVDPNETEEQIIVKAKLVQLRKDLDSGMGQDIPDHPLFGLNDAQVLRVQGIVNEIETLVRAASGSLWSKLTTKNKIINLGKELSKLAPGHESLAQIAGLGLDVDLGKKRYGVKEMKITKQRLQQIIQEEITSYKASQLNESIDADVLEKLEAAIGAAYNQMTTPTDVDQVYADTGEPVSKDPEVMHQEAVEMIMHIVTDVTGIKGDLQEQ